MNTHVTVSDMRHDVSKIREDLGSQVRPVSLTLYLVIAEYSQPPRLKSGQPS